ncbi:hypothetical protein F4604DRAFT_1809218 [Suillus subluteus]|nr:hypothetical protein F4604DRAFT_1809218 [Suillus subluteus]
MHHRKQVNSVLHPCRAMVFIPSKTKHIDEESLAGLTRERMGPVRGTSDFTLNSYDVLYDRLDTRLELLVPVRCPLLQIFAAHGCLAFARQAWVHDGGALLQRRGLILRGALVGFLGGHAWLRRLLMFILKLELVLVSRCRTRPGFLQRAPEGLLVRLIDSNKRMEERSESCASYMHYQAKGHAI